MAFGNIAAFYFPTSANAGTSQWGTDVRKLLGSADAGTDNSTVTSHGTGGATTRTLDPYSTKTTDDTQANFGWAVTPSDMNSVTGARRYIPAGNHNVVMRTQDQNVLGTSNVRMDAYVYRVGPAPGRTRTLLGNASTTYNLPASGAGVTATVAVNLAEIIFEEDETIQYSMEFNAPGTIVGHLVDHNTGTQGGVAVRVDLPGGGLGTLYERGGAVTASGVAALGRRTVGKAQAVAATAAAAMQRYLRLGAKTATAVGVAAIQKYIKPVALAVAGTGAAGGFRAVLPVPFSVAGIGLAAQTKTAQIAKAVTAVGVAGFSKFVEAFRAFSVTAVGQAGFARALIAVRAFKVVGAGIAALYVKIKQTILNRLEGGAQIIRRTIINLFGED